MTLRPEFLTDKELVHYLYVENKNDPIVSALVERLEMRNREVSDLQNDIMRLEDELENFALDHDCDCDH